MSLSSADANAPDQPGRTSRPRRADPVDSGWMLRADPVAGLLYDGGGLSWRSTCSRRHRLRGRDLDLVLAFWTTYLGILVRIQTERIDRYMVTGADGRPGAELVGVVRDGCLATILHTRALTAEDLVHEL